MERVRDGREREGWRERGGGGRWGGKGDEMQQHGWGELVAVQKAALHRCSPVFVCVRVREKPS